MTPEQERAAVEAMYGAYSLGVSLGYTDAHCMLRTLAALEDFLKEQGLVVVRRNLLDALVSTYAAVDGSTVPEPRFMLELKTQWQEEDV